MDMKMEQTVDKAKLADLLRCYVGRDGIATVDQVSDFTGIAVRTIYDHIDTKSQTSPNAIHLAAYMSLFGADFTNDYLAMIGQGGAVETDIARRSVHSHLANKSKVVASLADALSDGHIDHRERRVLPGVLRRCGAESFHVAAAIEANRVAEAI